MTIPESLRLSLEAIPTGTRELPPPVNNACMPDQFNKLDADAIERTRVCNALLTLRFRVQEKVLNKYKNAAELSYLREKDKIKGDLRSISRRLPNYADIPNLESKIKKLRKRKKSNNGPLHNCVYTTSPVGMKGLSEDKDDKPICDRFIHHHMPTRGKGYKQILPSVNEGLRGLDMRPRPPGARLIPLVSHHHTRDTRDVIHIPRAEHVTSDSRGSVIRPLHALDDNFTLSRSRLRDEDDDCKTV